MRRVAADRAAARQARRLAVVPRARPELVRREQAPPERAVRRQAERRQGPALALRPPGLVEVAPRAVVRRAQPRAVVARAAAARRVRARLRKN